MKFNFLKKEKKEETIEEKLKRYESETYKTILKIVSKLPRSRRDAFLDRLTGNIIEVKKLTDEEKELLLEKYKSKEYEFILSVKKSLEEEKKAKEKIKEKFENKENNFNQKELELEEETKEEIDYDDINYDDQEDISEQEIGLEKDEKENIPETEFGLGEETENIEEDNDLFNNEEIPEDNWNPNEFFCDSCFESFKLTDEEIEKIKSGETKELICKKCGNKIDLSMIKANFEPEFEVEEDEKEDILKTEKLENNNQEEDKETHDDKGV